MTAPPNLTAPQRHALLWLAETPGEWRMSPQRHEASSRSLMQLLIKRLVQSSKSKERVRNGNYVMRYRLTTAGIQAAKELSA